MRLFVFLLILANLLFLAWTQGYFGMPNNPDAFRVSQQLQPEKIVIVARGEPPPLTKSGNSALPVPLPASPSSPASENAAPNAVPNAAVKPESATAICLVLRELPTSDAEKLESAITAKFPSVRLQRTAVPASGSYWVNIPPLASKQEADNKAAELKKLNVPEFFIVQESGPNNRAISLGLFSSRDAAQARFDMLRDRGVRSAKITERNVRVASTTIELQAHDMPLEPLQQAIAEIAPESKPLACKDLVAGQ